MAANVSAACSKTKWVPWKRGIHFFSFPLASQSQVEYLRTCRRLCFLTKHNRYLLGEAVWLRRLSISWERLSHRHQTPDCRSSPTHRDSPPLKAAHRRKGLFNAQESVNIRRKLTFSQCSKNIVCSGHDHFLETPVPSYLYAPFGTLYAVHIRIIFRIFHISWPRQLFLKHDSWTSEKKSH